MNGFWNMNRHICTKAISEMRHVKIKANGLPIKVLEVAGLVLEGVERLWAVV